MSNLSYGEVLYHCQAIFNLPFIKIPNLINKTDIYITTKGVFINGVVEDDSGEKKYKRIDRNLTKWDVVMVEPDASNDSFNIPLLNQPLTPSYTLCINMNKYTKRAVKIKGLRKEDLDAIISAGGIAEKFTDDDDRVEALKIWKTNYLRKQDLKISEYKTQIALNRIESKLKYISFFWDDQQIKHTINEGQRNSIVNTAKEMIKQGELTFDDLKLTPTEVLKKVVAYNPELINRDRTNIKFITKQQQYT